MFPANRADRKFASSLSHDSQAMKCNESLEQDFLGLNPNSPLPNFIMTSGRLLKFSST